MGLLLGLCLCSLGVILESGEKLNVWDLLALIRVEFIADAQSDLENLSG
jgi:hypothetical protein